ncbi:hypothetical protein TNIN_290361 [Trichonephila inaurata madagascariensis]|uniref:Uncharacterized protein n=1 Tax=Trichonephila inaurata madagascariensis TaxID=2747483 RepID=A0A8X6YYP8_9ARAC|nr:hypothetical protein TNIN_290361 [Trichonephila inaurata madagascariensis]
MKLSSVVVVHFLQELDDQTCCQDFHDVALVSVMMCGHHEAAVVNEDAAEEEDCKKGREEKGAEFHLGRMSRKEKIKY